MKDCIEEINTERVKELLKQDFNESPFMRFLNSFVETQKADELKQARKSARLKDNEQFLFNIQEV